MSTFPLNLHGFDPNESIWGWDPGQNVLYAQLYRPGSADTDRGPDIWIAPPRYQVERIGDLAEEIAGEARLDADVVRQALGNPADSELYRSS